MNFDDDDQEMQNMKDVQDNTNSSRICEEDEEDDEDAYLQGVPPKRDSPLKFSESKTNIT